MSGTHFAVEPLETYAEVTERPLFSPSRRSPPPQLAQGKQTDAGGLVLSGIILTSDARVALVQSGKTAPAKRLTEGQEIEGWSVQSILPDRIVLRRGATEHELKLKLHDDTQRTRPAAPAVRASTN
jgi:general secretion pathway protein N